MEVTVTRYSVFVTSQSGVIFTFPNHVLAKCVDTICILFYTHVPFPLYNVPVINMNFYQRFKLGDRSKTQRKDSSS